MFPASNQIRAVLCRTVRQDYCIIHTIMSQPTGVSCSKSFQEKENTPFPSTSAQPGWPCAARLKRLKVDLKQATLALEVTRSPTQLQKLQKIIFFIILKTKHIYLKSKIVRTEIRLALTSGL